jgi:hypothetical protein
LHNDLFEDEFNTNRLLCLLLIHSFSQSSILATTRVHQALRPLLWPGRRLSPGYNHFEDKKTGLGNISNAKAGGIVIIVAG